MGHDRTTVEMGGRDKVVVYTCVIDNYDSVVAIENIESDVEFVCFSERPDKVPAGWTGMRLQSPPRLHSAHDINRFHKLFPHRIFSGIRFSIYLDGNARFRGPFRELVEKLRDSNAALAAFTHPNGRSVREEARACEHFGKFDFHDLARMTPQLDQYRRRGFDVSQPITANYLLVRDHAHPRIETAMSLWWSALFEFTKRDQMSLNYVLWETGTPWVTIDGDLKINSSRLERVPHAINLWTRIYRGIKHRMDKSSRTSWLRG